MCHFQLPQSAVLMIDAKDKSKGTVEPPKRLKGKKEKEKWSRMKGKPEDRMLG